MWVLKDYQVSCQILSDISLVRTCMHNSIDFTPLSGTPRPKRDKPTILAAAAARIQDQEDRIIELEEQVAQLEKQVGDAQ